MSLQPVNLVGIACDGCDAVLLHPIESRPMGLQSRVSLVVAVEDAQGSEDPTLRGWQGWTVGLHDGEPDFCPGCTRLRA